MMAQMKWCKPLYIYTYIKKIEVLFFAVCILTSTCCHTHGSSRVPQVRQWCHGYTSTTTLDGDKVLRIFSWHADPRRFSVSSPPSRPPPTPLTFRPEVVRIFQFLIYLECTSSVIPGHSLFGGRLDAAPAAGWRCKSRNIVSSDRENVQASAFFFLGISYMVLDSSLNVNIVY